jgi:hypothetical protein
MKFRDRQNLDYPEVDKYLKLMFKLLEGFADFKEAEKSLNLYFTEKGDNLPPEIKEMMAEILEEKRKKMR